MNPNLRSSLRVGATIWFAVMVALSAQRGNGISIDVPHVFQTMDGFGSSERLFDDPHVTETFDQRTQRSAVVLTRAEEDEVLARLYVELGLTRVRPIIEGGIEPVNDNRDPGVTDLSKFD